MSAGVQRIDIAVTNALNRRQARLAIGVVAAGCIAVALLWTARGFWPVLPFAGLEILVFALALRANRRRALQWQTIFISEDQIRIRKRGKSGTAREVVFPRYWTRVKLSRSAIASHPGRLTLESSGKSCEVGEFLTEDRRRELARQLRGLVGRMGEIPAPDRVSPG
ncbi:MAG: DUF2244 domain-containing protein [Steroidobacteraceae bacterium]